MKSPRRAVGVYTIPSFDSPPPPPQTRPPFLGSPRGRGPSVAARCSSAGRDKRRAILSLSYHQAPCIMSILTDHIHCESRAMHPRLSRFRRNVTGILRGSRPVVTPSVRYRRRPLSSDRAPRVYFASPRCRPLTTSLMAATCPDRRGRNRALCGNAGTQRRMMHRTSYTLLYQL